MMKAHSDRAAAASRADPIKHRGSSFATGLIVFVLLFALVWGTAYYLRDAFKFIRPGADLVAEAKFDRMAAHNLFAQSSKARILIFGNSTILAGFRPDVFDKAAGHDVQSVNFGLPGETAFLPILSAALKHGNRPTHVLLTADFPLETAAPGWGDRLRDDKNTVGTLFPFRSLLRDFTAFAVLSKGRFADEYRVSKKIVDQVVGDRGWYFIKSQSHFPNDQLPGNYSLPTDHPDTRYLRNAATSSWVFAELGRLAKTYKFTVVIVPGNMRRGAFAPVSGQTNRLQILSQNPRIVIAGPDYFSFPNSRYADPVHLNPAGSAEYSTALAKLLDHLGVLG